MQSTSWETLDWKKHKLESRLLGEISITSDYADDNTLMAESEEELKKPLHESERGEWKSRLKAQHSENEDHGIWSHHFMGNRWGKSGNSVRLYFGGSKITAAMKLKDACSLEEPRQHIKKQRHYFANKGPSSKSYGFSSSHVWMWELKYKESWAPKNWSFEAWCWRRLLRVPWIARRSNQSILKEVSPEYSLEALMLKLKLQ